MPLESGRNTCYRPAESLCLLSHVSIRIEGRNVSSESIDFDRLGKRNRGSARDHTEWEEFMERVK